MMKNNNRKISRREFVGGAAASVAAFTYIPRYVLGQAGNTPPGKKLNIACIGCGGMGGNDIRSVSSENIVALCDVDARRAADTFKRYPKAKKYRDFRIMLEKEEKNIDAVTVSTPDHIHAVAAMMAMKMGKHVYCQKPLAHDIFEVREMTKAAQKYKVVTQMGTQIHASNGMKLMVEMIKTGMIGPVREVHIWSDKKWGGGTRPADTPPTPPELDWNLWLGPAPQRPYHPTYVPENWRKWWDFGTGTLGDMGCHIFDPAFWALDLQYPLSVEADPGPYSQETYPTALVVRYEFPARQNLPPVTLTWYDGDRKPPRPKELEAERKLPSQGGLYVGEKGTILYPHMGAPRLIPESKMKGFKTPKPFLPRGVDHYQEWIHACKGGPKPLSNFDYSGPVSECVLLGNLAIRAGKRLEWDGENMNVTNISQANRFLRRDYRKGWTL